MKALKIEIPEETIKRIRYLALQAGLSKETVVVTALIIGTMKLDNWIKEDD